MKSQNLRFRTLKNLSSKRSSQGTSHGLCIFGPPLTFLEPFVLSSRTASAVSGATMFRRGGFFLACKR